VSLDVEALSGFKRIERGWYIGSGKSALIAEVGGLVEKFDVGPLSEVQVDALQKSVA